MKKFLLLSLLSAMILPATELSAKKKQEPPTEVSVRFDSNPRGARVIIDNKTLGITPFTATVPVTSVVMMDLDEKDEKGRVILGPDILTRGAVKANKISVRFVKDGYFPGEEEYKPKVQKNKLYKGGYQFIWSESVFHEFDSPDGQSAAYQKDTSIPAGEANKVVNRDRPGQTALERTVIRWYFESAPQGARIFWRVISSVPDQVKNTNENWLGNTPFEETRSFNIQGLTYENSRDVQIEIKVRRPGYLDQTKRFNVRQAIDQQEISSFFDMIKAD